MSRALLRLPACFALALLVAAGGPVLAQEKNYLLTIRNHQFEPVELEVPAGVKVTLQVKNEDATPEEFESAKLHREKVVPGGKEINIFIGPLTPGRYEFIGDFNRATAHGAIVVK